MSNSIKLQTNSVLNVPFENYQKDFAFYVNSKEFKTSKFCADLLSTKISKIHQNDPTMSEYYINTQSTGDFQHVLDLLKFDEIFLQEDEIPFLSEIFDDLCPSNMNINNFNIKLKATEINHDNVIELIKKHEQSAFFYSTFLTAEIEYLSSHFYEMSEMSIDTIKQIINNDKLEIDTEDQLLTFVNDLYSKSFEYSELYEYVYFDNVSAEKMREFLSLFDIEYLTGGTWKSIPKRLLKDEETIENENESETKSKKKQDIEIK